MKRILRWALAAAVLMLGAPWLAVEFAGSGGMAVCFILFYAVDPVFAAACGAAAGKDMRRAWWLPAVPAAAFLAGAWLVFEIGEPAFMIYAAGYLIIGVAAMLISAYVKK